MSNENKDLAKRLRILEKKATKGPWFQWTQAGDLSSQPEDCLIMQTLWTKKNKDGCVRTTARGNADMHLVATLRNNLPAIIEALEAKP